MPEITGGKPRVLVDRARPKLPQTAVVTGGMPYGNKPLHFGHIGGVFIQADATARFLKDRIGSENVVFVSGTDGFGSPIIAGHKKMTDAGGTTVSIADWVRTNHEAQKATLAGFRIEPSLFGASCIEPYLGIHRGVGEQFFETLHRNGFIFSRQTSQFFDPELGRFLNGREVEGFCPMPGCKSERGFADECTLGHAFEPTDLIKPISIATGKTPEFRPVTNWYLRMEPFRRTIEPWLNGLLADSPWRDFSVKALLDYFAPPKLNVKTDFEVTVIGLKDQLPAWVREEGGGKSFLMRFETLEDLDRARATLAANHVLTRPLKTLVPFRLSGNLPWGLPFPEAEGSKDLTWWVWPESLFAPISFTQAHLRGRGEGDESWKRFWCSPNGAIYQFIGEDNVFFYGLPEIAMFLGMQGREFQMPPPEGQLQMPTVIANLHALFLGSKASSSGNLRPPMADDILRYYTSDQMRALFFSMGLHKWNGDFRPKLWMEGHLDPESIKPEEEPDEKKRKELKKLKEAAITALGIDDPVVKLAAFLKRVNTMTNNVIATSAHAFGGQIPAGEISPAALEAAEKAALDFEAAFMRFELSGAYTAAEDLVLAASKRFNDDQIGKDATALDVRRQGLIDCMHMMKVATILLHSIAPDGAEAIRNHFGFGEDFWSWEKIFDPVQVYMADPGAYRVNEAPPPDGFFPLSAHQKDRMRRTGKMG